MPDKNETANDQTAQSGSKQEQSSKQSSLEYSRAVQRTMVKNQFVIERMGMELAANRETLGDVIKLIAANPDLDPDLAGQIKKAAERNVEQSKTLQAQGEHQDVIADAVQEAETDWDADPRLEEARVAWGKGDYDNASKLTTAALDKADKPDFDERVKKEAAQMLKAKGFNVNLGESQLAEPGMPTTAEELNERAADPVWWKEHGKDALAAMKSGKIKIAPAMR